MTKKEFLKSNYFKILFPILIVTLVFALWKNGYEFGQWLHKVFN
jgi:hypothetical protein